MQPSLTSGNGVSGQVCGLSGVVVGNIVDLIAANTMCNVYVGGLPALASGLLIIGVQCSDSTASGTFTDPTSGLQTLPTVFSSGGNLVLNSGATGGTYNAFTSGQGVLSGFIAGAAFQRPQRFARLLFNSGFYIGTLQAGFISQLKQTGSGGGYSILPSSGGISV